jgi:HSP20 family protein
MQHKNNFQKEASNMFELQPFRRDRSLSNVPATLDWADRIFNELMPSRLFREVMPSLWGEHGEIMPAFDISEADGHLVVRADLPGIDVKNIDISLSGNALTVKGERKDEKTEKNESWYYCGRQFGTFSRTFTLPSDVKEEGIEATYKDGVLEVKIPMAETAKQKKIEVKTH